MGLETGWDGADERRREVGSMKTVVVAGTSSGVGKTTIAVGLMAAFSRRGLRVQPFKVGPDFLDPMHHKAATGRESFNLDGWMLNRDVNLACFMRCAETTDIAIVEGVMGLYDGRDGKSEVGSTAEMAKLLGAPVVLVLDCWALARSAAAMIRGYTTFDKDLKFAGVIFNKVGGASHTAWLTEAVLTTEHNVRVLGGVPKTSNIEIPERHLGLHMPSDDTLPQNYMDRLAHLVEGHVDLDAILEAAATVYNPLQGADVKALSIMRPILPKLVRIGVAQDAAFCFYYHENLAQLQDAGAELVYFSPLKDSLPPSLDAIYFSGGYPELHSKQLSDNKAMLYAVKAFADAGGVVYGECGGLMYLSQGIEGRDGERHGLCGVFPFWTRMQAAMQMGYVKVKPQENCVLFPTAVGEIRGQVYHFSDIVESEESCGKGFAIKFEYATAVEKLEGFMYGNAMATYVHLHFGSNPAVAYSFVDCCRMDPTKAAAVAAASASAVADAGPAAAAAAGAAAAAAVAAAVGESREAVQFQSSDVMFMTDTELTDVDTALLDEEWRQCFNNAMVAISPTPNIPYVWAKSMSEEQVSKLRNSEMSIRRWASFDLGRNGFATDPRKLTHRLIRSESEFSFAVPKDGRNSRVVARALPFTSDSSSDENVEGSRTGAAGTSQNALQTREGSDRESCSSNGTSIDSESTQNVYAQDIALQQRAAIPSNRGRRRVGSGITEQEFSAASLVARHRDSTNKAGVPQRILSLLPSATEILMGLGAGSRLLGVTDLCNKPVGVGNGRHIVCRSKIDTSIMSSHEVEVAMKTFAAEKKSPFVLDESWIADVKPDLVLTQDTCENCDIDSSEVASALARARLVNGTNTRVIVLRPRTVAEILASILDIGEATGLYAEASLQVKELRARLRKVAAAVAMRPRPLLMLLQGLDPLVLGGHWIPDMESLAGGYDGLQKPGCSAERLHWPRIVAYAPEILLFAPCSSSLERTLSEVSMVAGQPGFWSIPAVERRQVYILEHSYFSRPSESVVDGVELLASILHPTAGISSLKVKGVAMKLSLASGQRCRPQDLKQHFKDLQ